MYLAIGFSRALNLDVAFLDERVARHGPGDLELTLVQTFMVGLYKINCI